MIPKFSDEFAEWIVGRLIDDGILQRLWYMSNEDIKVEIRRILMESEREGENEQKN